MHITFIGFTRTSERSRSILLSGVFPGPIKNSSLIKKVSDLNSSSKLIGINPMIFSTYFTP